jgi:8-oxo-dGTP pyrophosphatase MutT (NUDIX family)
MLPTTDLKQRLCAALNTPGAASSDFDLNVGMLTPENPLTDAAVLIAFMPSDNAIDLVLTKRSSALKHHPGQIAFPGGKFDHSDGDLKTTALREAYEEIALPSSDVEVLGMLPPHQTVTSFQVNPYIGWINTPVAFKPEPGEVSEVFRVPAAHILNPANYRVEGRYWRGQMRRYYAVPYGPYYIWGATARMLRSLAEQMST